MQSEATTSAIKLQAAIKPAIVEVSAEQTKILEKLLNEVVVEILNDSHIKIITTLNALNTRLNVIEKSIGGAAHVDDNNKKTQATLETILDRLTSLEERIKNTPTNIRVRESGPSKNMFTHGNNIDIDFD